MGLFKNISLLSLVSLALASPAAVGSPSTVSRRDTDTVQFTIEITWEDYVATGGAARKAILTNGTIPGPPLKVQVGQTVEFTTINNLPFGTSVHFHGIEQLNTPWSDGVAGLSQWPIPPGETFLQTWVANEPGTYFYHAHDKGQMMDGLYGAIIVEASSSTARPFGLISGDSNDVTQMLAAESCQQPIFVSDWSQYTFGEFFQIQQDANIDNSCADAIIVNGKGSVYCQSRADINAWTAPPLKPILQSVNPPQLTDKGCLPPNLVASQGNFTFDISSLPAGAYETCTPSTGETATINVNPADGWAAMTFISPAGFSILKFTIDNHKMWVYAVSGAYVTPQEVDQIVIGNGARYSVLIKLDQPVGTYKINVANSGLNQIISGYASLVYQGSTGPAAGDVSLMNYAGYNTTAITTFNDALASPYDTSLVPAATADVTFSLDIMKLSHPYTWTLSGVQGYNMSNDDQTPLLFKDPSTIPTSDVILRTNYGQWVDLIVQVAGPLAQPHPMHKHSNRAYVIGAGLGPFNFSTVAQAAAAMPAGTFNFKNPPFTDSFTTPAAEGGPAWMVLRYKVENPGAWLFHCHIQTHLSGGMAVVILDGIDKYPAIPPQYSQGNGFPMNSSSFKSITSATSGDDTSSSSGSNGASSSPKPAASNGAYQGAATTNSFSSFVALSALVAVVAGLML